MNSKLNKRERRAAALLAHYATCERLALALGMDAAKVDGKRISVALWKIERDTHQSATDYCNGDINGDQWETIKERTRAFVAKVFGTVPPGFFVNGDARGYALKIDNENASGRELIESCRLHTDWGQYGILSPEITGD